MALGCLFTAALLLSFEQPRLPEPPGCQSSHDLAALLGQHGDWEMKYQAEVEDLECKYFLQY